MARNTLYGNTDMVWNSRYIKGIQKIVKRLKKYANIMKYIVIPRHTPPKIDL